MSGLNSKLFLRIIFGLTNISIACTVIIFIVPSYQVGLISWSDISPINWLRLIASMYLTSFAPGYYILRISRAIKYLDRLGTVLMSYLLSVLFTSTLGFALLMTGLSIWKYSQLFLVLFNIALALIATLNFNKSQNYVRVTSKSIRFSLYDVLVFLIAMGTVIGAVVINTSNSLFLMGAQNTQLNQAIGFFKEFPVGLQGNYASGYDYWFFLYLASFISLSGLPIVNAYLSLLVFVGMPTLAFYEMIRRLTSSNIFGLIATILMSFQGFGWIYALYSKLTNPSYSLFEIFWTVSMGTYDLVNAVVWLPNIVHPLFLVTLPAFCVLVYQIFEGNSAMWTKYLFISPLVFLGYVSHHYEIVFFIALYSLMLLLKLVPKTHTNEINISLSIVLGIALVGIIDLISPAKQFLINANSSPLGPPLIISQDYMLSLILCLFSLVTSIYDIKISLIRLGNQQISKKITPIKIILGRPSVKVASSGILIFIYFLLLMVWIKVHYEIEVGEYLYVPIYAYVIRFGIDGVMALATLILIFLGIFLIKGSNVKRFFIQMSLMGLFAFVLGRTSSIFGLGYEARIHTFLLMSFASVSTFMVKYLFSLRATSKKLTLRRLSTILLIMVFCSGAISSIMYIKLWSVTAKTQEGIAKISLNEVKALDFLRNETSPSDYILTVSKQSLVYLATLTGITNNLYYPLDTAGEDIIKAFWTASTPETLGYLLIKIPIKYIYLAERDIEMLNTNPVFHGLLYQLLNFFPIVYSNPEAKIFKVPDLAALSSYEKDIWADIPLTPSYWTITYVQNVSAVKVNFASDRLQIEGKFNKSRGIIIVRNDDPNISTDKYPYFSVKWMGSGNVASVVIWYKDGSSTIVIRSQSAPYWKETIVLLPPNKTVSAIELRADNFWSISRGENLEGYCSASYEYVKFYSYGSLVGKIVTTAQNYKASTQTLSHVMGNITLNGNITFKATAIKQFVGELTFSNEMKIDMIREMIENSPVKIILHNSKATILPLGSENLVQINIIGSSNMTISITGANQSIEAFFKSAIQIILEKPEFLVDGNTTFSHAYFWPYEPRSWGKDLNLEGFSHFSLLTSSNSFQIVDMKEIKGKVNIYGNDGYVGKRNELRDILNFINSTEGMLNVLITSSITLLIVVYLRKIAKRGSIFET